MIKGNNSALEMRDVLTSELHKIKPGLEAFHIFSSKCNY
jgi:hypothetical protein